MRLRDSLCVFLTLAWATQTVAQTIQLPSFNVFSVDTTVLVPDSGPAPIARNRRVTSGTNNFAGFPRQRAIGIDRQVTGAHVIATIHDTQDADEALLQRAGGQRPGARTTTSAQTMPAQTMAIDGVAGDAKLASVDELRRRRDAQAMASQQEAFLIFERARQAQAAGKPAVATVYYRSAANRATGALRQEIIAAWRSMKMTQGSARRETNSDRGATDR